jgi:hypothetical protein
MNKYFFAIQEKGGWSADDPPVIAIFKVPSFEKFKDDPYIHVNSVIVEVDVYKTFHIVYEDIPTPDQDHGFRTLKLAKRQLIRFGFNSGLPRL